MIQKASNGLWKDVWRRLVSNRYPLAAALLIFGFLLFTGRISAPLFAGLCAIMVGVSLFAPVRTVAARRAARSERDAGPASLASHGAVLDGVPDPLLLIDPRGVVQHANLQFRRVLGAMQPGSSVLIRFRSPEVLEMVQEALAGGRPRPIEYLERAPREHWFSVSIIALPGAPATEPGYLMHFRDLSELRRAERMRTDFIANASHELRTPLASLTGFIETLSGAARDDASARDRFLGIMHEQAERMSRLIDDLLSLSRFETALGRSDFGPVDLSDVLAHVSGAFQPVAARDNITLVFDHDQLSNDNRHVHGSRDELIQLFDNLVENAIKYGGEGERVQIVASSGELGGLPAVVVDIVDDGPGVDEDHIPRLTERFYRVNVESSRDKQGTGLGLAIVKHIVTRHEGRLSIQSQPGEGVKVRVTLPATGADKIQTKAENSELSIA